MIATTTIARFPTTDLAIDLLYSLVITRPRVRRIVKYQSLSRYTTGGRPLPLVARLPIDLATDLLQSLVISITTHATSQRPIAVCDWEIVANIADRPHLAKSQPILRSRNRIRAGVTHPDPDPNVVLFERKPKSNQLSSDIKVTIIVMIMGVNVCAANVKR